MGLRMGITRLLNMDSQFIYETHKDAFYWKKEFNEPQNINRHVIHIVLDSVFMKRKTYDKVRFPIFILLYNTFCKKQKVCLNSTLSINPKG